MIWILESKARHRSSRLNIGEMITNFRSQLGVLYSRTNKIYTWNCLQKYDILTYGWLDRSIDWARWNCVHVTLPLVAPDAVRVCVTYVHACVETGEQSLFWIWLEERPHAEADETLFTFPMIDIHQTFQSSAFTLKLSAALKSTFKALIGASN